MSRDSSGTSSPSSSYLPPSFSHAVSGFLKRLSSDPGDKNESRSVPHAVTFPSASQSHTRAAADMNTFYGPPHRSASPFQPPPLYPLNLKGYSASTSESAQLLSRAVAEEIRLLVPPRLQLCEEWNLVYSLEQDGASLSTLYSKCDELRGLRNGFVLAVRDGEGSLFGAYLTEAPHVSPHFFGTGECFLWRASILSSNPALLLSLPPPPSADTTNLQRSTTLGSSRLTSPTAPNFSSLAPPTSSASQTGTSTPERIRFKAFPYSGVNDYLILCEAGFLSIGGGDGHYGLWLDDTFEKGISSSCPTFGNEPLSDEGQKFDILGVEIWSVGNS